MSNPTEQMKDLIAFIDYGDGLPEPYSITFAKHSAPYLGVDDRHLMTWGAALDNTSFTHSHTADGQHMTACTGDLPSGMTVKVVSFRADLLAQAETFMASVS